LLRIFIAFRDAAPFLARCVRSVQNQAFRNWTCDIFDDVSTDDSLNVCLEETRDDSRFILHKNEKRMWQTGNLYTWAHSTQYDDRDIAFMIDGDDWLPDDRVFDRVLDAYSDPRIWTTYGNFQYVDNEGRVTKGHCQQLTNARAIRQLPWITSAPHTFNLFLFRQIALRDLCTSSGDFIPVCGDLAFTFPTIEMAGDCHSICLPDVNYSYNIANPRNEFKVMREQKRAMSRFLRTKPSYPALQSSDAPF
jgi:glycosyltransferase involved in cell wall biosynthesis